jgi:hypothetical protein
MIATVYAGLFATILILEGLLPADENVEEGQEWEAVAVGSPASQQGGGPPARGTNLPRGIVTGISPLGGYAIE